MTEESATAVGGSARFSSIYLTLLDRHFRLVSLGCKSLFRGSVLVKIIHSTDFFSAGTPPPTDLNHHRSGPPLYPWICLRCRAVLPYVWKLNKPHTTISNFPLEALPVCGTPPIALRRGRISSIPRFRCSIGVVWRECSLPAVWIAKNANSSNGVGPDRSGQGQVDRRYYSESGELGFSALPSRLFGRSGLADCSDRQLWLLEMND